MGLGVIEIVAALVTAIVVYLAISSFTNKDGDSTGTCNGNCTSAGDGCIAAGNDCSQIVRFVDSPILTNCPTNKGCNFIGATTVGTCEGTCSDDQNGCTAALADCSGLQSFLESPVIANCPVDSGCNFIVPPAPPTVTAPPTGPAPPALAGPTGTCTGNCSDDQNGCTAQADCSGLQSFQESPVRANCPTDSGCTFTASTRSTENHEECENGAPCGGPPPPCKEARICHNKTCPPLTNKPDGVVGPDGVVIRTTCNMLTDDREVDVVGVCSQGICVSNVDDDTIISDDGVDFQAVAVADWPTLSTTWQGEEATDGGGTGSWDPVQVVPGYTDVYALDDNGYIHHKPIQGGQPWYIWSYGPAGGATQIDVDGTSMWATAGDNTYHKLLSDTNYKQDSWTLVDDGGNGLHVSANGAYLWQVMEKGFWGASWDVGYKIGAGDGSYGAMTAKKLPDSMNDSMKMVSVSGGAGSEMPEGVSYVWGVSHLGDIYRTLSDGSAEWEKLGDNLGGIEWNWISGKGRKNIWATATADSGDQGVYKCSKPCEGVAGKIPWEKIHAGGLLTNIAGSPYNSLLDEALAANQVWGVNSDNNMFTLSQQ